MPTAEKVAAVAQLSGIMKRASGIYLTDFTGLDVPTFVALRRRLREEAVACRVVKNRLAILAAKDAGVGELDALFSGPTGMVYTEDDPVLPARLLASFANDADGRPKMKAGLVEGRVYLNDELKTLALLPPRDMMLGQVVATIQGPLSGLAFCLAGMLQKLLGTLDALAEQRKAAKSS
jgi:large subunit ribosomal protein L10